MRATRAIIHLDSFRHNLRLLRGYLGSRTLICLSVKANAYGHGAIKIAAAAVEEGVQFLAVATCDEGLELRRAGLACPILLLGLPMPGEIEELIENDISCVVCDSRLIEKFEGAVRALDGKKTAKLHLKIDTGMGRIGCQPEQAGGLALRISDSAVLELEGVATHLPMADREDREYTTQQIALFRACIEDIRRSCDRPLIAHAANSAGALWHGESVFDMVRPGIIAYGYYPSRDGERFLGVKPVMEFVSRVVMLKKVAEGTAISYGHSYRCKRETTIATVAAGYGDGYNRLLSNRGKVSIRGVLYPVVGTVCMDQFMVDVGPRPAVELL